MPKPATLQICINRQTCISCAAPNSCQTNYEDFPILVSEHRELYAVIENCVFYLINCSLQHSLYLAYPWHCGLIHYFQSLLQNYMYLELRISSGRLFRRDGRWHCLFLFQEYNIERTRQSTSIAVSRCESSRRSCSESSSCTMTD